MSVDHTPAGLVITEVKPHSPLAAKTLPGDVIIALDGCPVAGEGLEDFAALRQASRKPQEKVTLVRRGSGTSPKKKAESAASKPPTGGARGSRRAAGEPLTRVSPSRG